MVMIHSVKFSRSFLQVISQHLEWGIPNKINFLICRLAILWSLCLLAHACCATPALFVVAWTPVMVSYASDRCYMQKHQIQCIIVKIKSMHQLNNYVELLLHCSQLLIIYISRHTFSPALRVTTGIPTAQCADTYKKRARACLMIFKHLP